MDIITKYKDSRNILLKQAGISPESKIFKADVGVKSEVDRIVDFAVSEYGRIDILVNTGFIKPERRNRV